MKKSIKWIVLASMCFSLASTSWADVVSADLQLTPPGSVNRMTMTVTASYSIFSASDSDTTNATGNIWADLGIAFDPVTHEVASVETVEFTGGTVSFSPMAFTLNFSFAGSINATGTGIGATIDTPIPPGTVTAGNFQTAEHVMVFNQGTFVATGTGIVGGMLDPNPMVIDLAAAPMEATTAGTGQLDASLASIADSLATYDVLLTLPVNFNETLMDDGTMSVRVAATGTVQAAGQFVRTLPPPKRTWDGNGIGNWGDLDGTGHSRWLNENGAQTTDVPNASIDAVVEVDTVSVLQNRSARSLTLASGGIRVVEDSTLAVADSLRIEDTGEYVCALGPASNGLIAATDRVDLAGELGLEATDHLGDLGLREWGDQTRTIISGAGGVFGTFTDVPEVTDPAVLGSGHLGFGVFLTDGGASGRGVRYLAESVVVDVFQAAPGDTNGDRQVEAGDIENILAANKFGRDVDADWLDGDFDGDDRVGGADIQSILAANLFGSGFYAGMESEEPADAALDLIVTPEGLLIDTGGAVINGYVLSSRTGIFTGEPADNLGLFREDTDGWITGNFGFQLNGTHLLGDVIGEEFAGVDLAGDLAFTYTIEGASGAYLAKVVVPEPSAWAMMLGGLAALWLWRRRPGR